MRYYLGSLEYKWSHVNTSMENMWVMREITPYIFRLCQQDGFELQYMRSNSHSLPEDVYCRCDVYVDVPNTPQGTHFKLTHGADYVEVSPLEYTQREARPAAQKPLAVQPKNTATK